MEPQNFYIGPRVSPTRFETRGKYSCGIDDEKVATLEESSDFSKPYMCFLFRLAVIDEESRIVTRGYRRLRDSLRIKIIRVGTT